MSLIEKMFSEVIELKEELELLRSLYRKIGLFLELSPKSSENYRYYHSELTDKILEYEDFLFNRGATVRNDNAES